MAAWISAVGLFNPNSEIAISGTEMGARPPRARFFAPSRKIGSLRKSSGVEFAPRAPKCGTRGAFRDARGGRAPRTFQPRFQKAIQLTRRVGSGNFFRGRQGATADASQQTLPGRFCTDFISRCPSDRQVRSASFVFPQESVGFSHLRTLAPALLNGRYG